MQINNLEFNILYLFCAPSGNEASANGTLHSGAATGELRLTEVLETFSDIPKRNMDAAIDTLLEAQMIAIDQDYTTLSITEKGTRHLGQCIPSGIG
ncbi:MAG: hypothetical protein P8010_16270 [Desulfosarcinaceae bacterium]|jgi:hypothetical protein